MKTNKKKYLKEILNRYFKEFDKLTIEGVEKEIEELINGIIEDAKDEGAEEMDEHWRKLDEQGKL